MEQLDKLIDYLELKKQWKTFIISLVIVFAMVSIPMLGLKISRLESNLASPVTKPQSSTKTKIEKILNDYKLIKKTTFVPNAHASSAYDEAKSFAVVDFDTGEVLLDKRLNDQLPIASITKVMTAVVALDLASGNDLFEVSEHASKTIPTKIGVVPHQSLTLSELLHAALIISANDAVEVIEENIDQKYGQGSFVRAMNEKATSLGLKNSHFTNPQGFDDSNHYSSSEDIAILSHYALKNYPLIAEIVKKDYELLPNNTNHKRFDLYNWNGLIGVYPNTTGVKIGNTDAALRTTAVISERNGKKILVVLLGAPGVLERDLWASQLLDLGFEKSLALSPINVSEEALKEKYSTWKYWN